MRIVITCALALTLGLPAYAQSEPPKGFLRCIGHAANNTVAEHTITIYSETASMDGSDYKLYSDDAFYQLEKPNLDETMSWIIINRVTGSYEISFGWTVVQQIKSEKGVCTKMDQKL